MPIPYIPVSKKVLIEQRLDEINKDRVIRENANRRERIRQAGERSVHEDTMLKITSAKNNASRRQQKYMSFTENVRIALFEHALFTVFNEAMKKTEEKVGKSIVDEGTVHALTYNFIHENGGPSVLMNNMYNNGHTSYFLGEMYNIINKHMKVVIEGIDKANIDTFSVAPKDMADFKNDVEEHCKKCDMSESIADRVTDSIVEFFKTNKEDKDKIVAALTMTKEKIDDMNGEDTEDIKESYIRKTKRYVAGIRNKPKNVYGEMVQLMAEAVVKNDDLRAEFMTEGNHIDMDRLVNKVSMMYGLLETVNTMRLIKVDNKYVQSVLESMRLG